MVDDGLYEAYWTPDFAEDVYCAVSYVAEELGSPIAARTAGNADLPNARNLPTDFRTNAFERLADRLTSHNAL